ncbi:MAG: segregation/condensation protein A [Pirellulales bacterium]|nr:segregation/condensation protein A [Pirellulales bacterium]
MAFRVDLDIFRGPLDLLLYLVRKHEVEITDIPVALIAEQYLAYLEVLKLLDVNAVGDFLEMASTLIEIKSRMVLPHAEEEETPIEDPRQELVRQLLEYKRFKDAASLLDERSRQWQERFARSAHDAPRGRDWANEPLKEVELWDLVSALARMIRDSQTSQPSNIIYDETPIHVFMGRIHQRLLAERQVSLADLFEQGMHKSTLIGIFLAILELVRHHDVRAEQDQLFGNIWLLPGERTGATLDLSAADNYQPPPVADAPDPTADTEDEPLAEEPPVESDS